MDPAKANGNPHASLKLTEFPQEVQQLMKEFDTDGSGGINVRELGAMINAYKDAKRQRRFLQVTLAVVLFALVLSSASTFGVSYAAIQLAKDTEPNAYGVLVLSNSGQSGETRPALSPEPTITDGIEIVHGLRRRLQQNFSQQNFSQNLARVITITESRVVEACHLFHQGAASHLVVAIDDQDYRVSATRFHRSCTFASGSYDAGFWSLSCPAESEVCDVSLEMPEMQQSQGERRLERALSPKVHANVDGSFGIGSWQMQDSTHWAPR